MMIVLVAGALFVVPSFTVKLMVLVTVFNEVVEKLTDRNAAW